MTVVKGLELLPGDEKKALLKLVKNAVAGLAACPTGGGLEVQGEHADTVLELLVAEGFKNHAASAGVSTAV